MALKQRREQLKVKNIKIGAGPEKRLPVKMGQIILIDSQESVQVEITGLSSLKYADATYLGVKQKS